jgi:hypothetical protein
MSLGRIPQQNMCRVRDTCEWGVASIRMIQQWASELDTTEYLLETCTCMIQELFYPRILLENIYWRFHGEAAEHMRPVDHIVHPATVTRRYTRGIVDHTNMSTSDLVKANPRLTAASIFLSQFQLDVRHIPGATNLVSNPGRRALVTSYDIG